MEMKVKIGILGAMLEEVSSIKEMMCISKETSIADRVYYEGKIGAANIVLTFSRWGKVASASTTTTLINKFEVDFVLFTGVAGAVSHHLSVGDVVVGNGLYQHDMDARPFYKQFQIPLTEHIIYKPNSVDVQNALTAVNLFCAKHNNLIEQQLLDKYAISKPTVYSGIIASGDIFVSNPVNNQHTNLNINNEDKTLAVEMEGAAVAQVCVEHNVPYIIIRTISDKADNSAAIDFQSFVTDIASQYSSNIVKEFIQLV